ncbi:hypothetical protein DFH06DRAFT_1178269 [Mycena polygramma]|nr:hypothetical protein DFH06DRAFT_1178269 [Mycena polygramma]
MPTTETQGAPLNASASVRVVPVEDGEIVEAEKIPGAEATEMSPLSTSGPLSEMTAEELDHAKDIVLDLLGWGVEPEYLVECGVSGAVIHRIFTDLRLRLPKNLAITEA